MPKPPTRERILDAAHRLFTERGVAASTMRQLALAADMSHGNLSYHFRTKEEILEALHGRLLAAAQGQHAELMAGPMSVPALVATVRTGFGILYDYRFFMRELNVILRACAGLRATFLEVGELRHRMYASAFSAAIAEGLMHAPAHPGAHDDLIAIIRVYSDYWLSSAELYDADDRGTVVSTYARLFVSLLRPYLTEKGAAQLAADLTSPA
ncbi:MAG: TetR/AcrR family transcriptional regulator [Myxococcota bacterium]